MKAAVLFKVNEPLVVTDVNLDPPKHGEVMVRIVASGICASDLHVMDGANPRTLPIILGHEGAGVIEEVGEGVSDLKVGDHVIISLAPACGRCFFCAKGKPNLCERMPFRNEGALFDGTKRLQTADRSLMGCAYGSARPWTDIPMIVDLFMSGEIKLRELVSHTTNLDSINQAIELVVQGKVARSVIIN